VESGASVNAMPDFLDRPLPRAMTAFVAVC
jgi:hypothetical protein